MRHYFFTQKTVSLSLNKLKNTPRTSKGFTIVELLIVIVIIGILAALVIVAYTGIQVRAKDSRRVSDMKAIIGGLEIYKTNNSRYPESSNNGPGGWEISDIDPSQFLQALKTGGNVSKVPVDPVNTSSKSYWYFRFLPGTYGCDAARGGYYVLGITDMESTGRPSPQSPGFSCSGINYQDYFDWVTGGYEN